MAEITLRELDSGVKNDGAKITPGMIFDHPVDGKKMADLPPPDGIPEERVLDLATPKIDTNVYSYKELVERLYSEPIRQKVKTHVTELDELLDGGLQGGELMVISAATKQGKTTMAQTMSYLQANGRDPIPSLFFSLEMSWQELTRKFIDMDYIQVLAKSPDDLPIYYPTDTRNVSLQWVDDHIGNAIKKHGIKIAYIDHLHFLIPMDIAKRNISLYVGFVVRSIKQMAKKYDIPIVLICHTTKIRSDEAPDVSSPRDSSFIVQEADFLLLMWRERVEKKNRKGDGGTSSQHISELFTGSTSVSLEANRRNGKGRQWSMGMINGYFHSWLDYEEIQMVTQNEEVVDNMTHEDDMLTKIKNQMEKMHGDENELARQKPLI